MTTKKAASIVIADRADFDAKVDALSKLQLDFEATKIANEQARQDLKKTHGDEEKKKSDEIKRLLKALEAYASAHREAMLPKDAKSVRTHLSRWGFRLGNPTLKTLAGWTWDRVTEALRKGKKMAMLRVKYEPMKDALLEKMNAESLEKFGMSVEQSETFFVERLTKGKETEDEV